MGTANHDELRKVAYRLWEERGCPDGSPEVDWERAEEEMGGADDNAYATATQAESIKADDLVTT